MNNLFRLQSIFRDVFDDPTLRLSSEMSVGNPPEWDSVATVQLVLACEAAFAVRFTIDEVAAIRSVGDFVEYLEARTAARDIY